MDDRLADLSEQELESLLWEVKAALDARYKARAAEWRRWLTALEWGQQPPWEFWTFSPAPKGMELAPRGLDFYPWWDEAQGHFGSSYDGPIVEGRFEGRPVLSYRSCTENRTGYVRTSKVW